MGWENAHLYVFRLTINEKTTIYGLPDPDWESADIHIRDSRRTKLDATVWAEWLGYTLLLEALQNPKHPEHERLRQWAGAYYDPEIFSVQQVNSALAALG